MRHGSDLFVNLCSSDDLREILQNERPGWDLWMFGEDMRNVNTGISTHVNHKWRAILKLSSFKQSVCVEYLGPGCLPCCPGFHVASEGFEAGRGLLQSTEEVQTVSVRR